MCILELVECNIIFSQTVQGWQTRMPVRPIKSCTLSPAIYKKHVPSMSNISCLTFNRDVNMEEYCTP